MKILVVGSEGIIGSYLLPMLSEHAVTRVDSKLGRTFEQWERESAGYSPDAVVHLGATILDVEARRHAGVEQFSNILVDYAVCSYIQRVGCRSVLMSSAVVNSPEDSYGWCKLTLERFGACLRGARVLRPYSGYSERQPSTYPFRALLERVKRREQPLTVWGGSQIRDFVHCRDIARAVKWALTADAPWPVDIGTGRGTTLAQLASMVAEAAGYRPDIHADTSKATGASRRVADPEPARSCGWAAETTLEQGIMEALRC